MCIIIQNRERRIIPIEIFYIEIIFTAYTTMAKYLYDAVGAHCSLCKYGSGFYNLIKCTSFTAYTTRTTSNQDICILKMRLNSFIGVIILQLIVADLLTFSGFEYIIY